VSFIKRVLKHNEILLQYKRQMGFLYEKSLTGIVIAFYYYDFHKKDVIFSKIIKRVAILRIRSM